MSNGNVFERLWKLETMIRKMIMDGGRKAEEVADWLEVVNKRPEFLALLASPRQANLTIDFPSDLWVPKSEEFYREVYGLKVNLLPAFKAAPEALAEFGWPVFGVPEVSMNRTWGECRNLFPCHSYLGDDLDRAVPTNDRTTADGPYLIRFRSRVEADQEMKNVSANQLKERKVKCITLHERLLLEQFVWWRSGGFHLDLLNVTLCAGSRGADGGVPSARWREGQFQVHCYYPDRAGGHLRARAAV